MASRFGNYVILFVRVSYTSTVSVYV